ncbi:hypothetical protein [Accumulibacter sp.]|uniref:hypothetical protein n=1 Tax=Accumulibacter sp. TaxID=2053492 RepID=UPI0028C44B87|nr:hypothetical protein [Accumulibacter sp.]
MRKSSLVVAALAATLLAMPAMAQFAAGMQSGMVQGMPGSDMGPGSTGMHGGARQARRGPVDCSRSADVEQCKARQQAHRKVFEACKDKVGAERRQCMHQQAQMTDCSQARNPQQCETRKQAYAACQGRNGAQFKRCVQLQAPSSACAQASDPALCAQHEKARTVCAPTTGAEHLQCLRDILAPAK